MDYETLTAQSKHNAAIEAEEMNLVAILKPTISIDGNKWCVLYGDNLQDGVAGFGDTPMQAVYAFNKAWKQPIGASNAGEAAPAAIDVRDAALEGAVKAMHKFLNREYRIVSNCIELQCETHDQAWNYLHEMRDIVNKALQSPPQTGNAGEAAQGADK